MKFAAHFGECVFCFLVAALLIWIALTAYDDHRPGADAMTAGQKIADDRYRRLVVCGTAIGCAIGYAILRWL